MKTAEEALARLRDAEKPADVAVYGELFGDSILPYETDWYVKVFAACKTRGIADSIFNHWAGPANEYKHAWEGKPLEEFPQVNLTRTASQIAPEKSVPQVIANLVGQIGVLLNSEPTAE